MSTDDDAVRAFFGAHAEAYRDSPRHARGADLDRLVEALDLAPGLTALDLATGPGHVARALARRGLTVTGLDLTPAMIAVAREAAATEGLSVTWVEGDVAALPFPDAAFDRVTCRRAAHHFPALGQVLTEAFRVLKPGGLLGISDMTAPALAVDALNTVERIRDRSHHAALTPDAWLDGLVTAGFRLRDLRVTVEPMTPVEWLLPVSPDSSAGQEALGRIADWPERVREALAPGGRFLKYRLLLVAEKPAA
jgi:2-polyprenyl-3-methyl-5-hydroxy-6-metoxy-1,4-benzoquinol methylase